MPVIKSAKKKLRKDKKLTLENKKFIDTYKKLVKSVEKNRTEKSLSLAFKAIDKGAKKGVLHKNKAARIKSRISKLLKNKPSKKSSK